MDDPQGAPPPAPAKADNSKMIMLIIGGLVLLGAVPLLCCGLSGVAGYLRMGSQRQAAEAQLVAAREEAAEAQARAEAEARASSSSDDAKAKAGRCYGKIQWVDGGADFKVQVVDSFADLHVQLVESFPDSAGKWQIVDSSPDFKVQRVDSFPDFKVRMVESFPGVQ